MFFFSAESHEIHDAELSARVLRLINVIDSGLHSQVIKKKYGFGFLGQNFGFTTKHSIFLCSRFFLMHNLTCACFSIEIDFSGEFFLIINKYYRKGIKGMPSMSQK